MKFSRKIRLTDPIIPYFTEEKKEDEYNLSKEQFITVLNNCHWGALKLFYSEVEFLVLASKYIDLNSCLIAYIGSADGFRWKYLFTKRFFPKVHSVLYDPRDFSIEPDDQITIKSGADGWFDDDKIEEVLKIANGRKILYISDIRVSDDDAYVRESLIYEDMMKQQRWAINMGAEFMLLKFRMFFYTKDPKEIDFIDNTLPEKEYMDKIVFKKDPEKHKDIHNWMLYLKGSIYTQLYAKPRSTEARLFVKKIKYHKDAHKYTAEEQEKYKMTYYSNIQYEGLFNYFNLEKRNSPVVYSKSDKMVKYIPGQTVSYTTASEYYIIKKYLKFAQEKQSFKNVLNRIVEIYTFLNNKYSNNLIVCGKFKTLKKINQLSQLNQLKSEKQEKNEEKIKLIKAYLEEQIDDFIDRTNKQFERIKKTKLLNEIDKGKFINSFKSDKNPYFDIKNGVLIKK
jgi:hypothetical protein